jgi:hypothetical protein
MSGTRARRRAGIGASVAIVIALCAGETSQASAATYYACVKKNATARIYTRKPHCRRGESRLTWNSQGPAGRNGRNGSNGANGKEGSQGVPGPLLETLPSGRTETGVYAVEGNQEIIVGGYSFWLPLATAPTGHFIADKATPTSECPGSVSSPRAAPGNLCVYEGVTHGHDSNDHTFNPENEATGGSASRFGFAFYMNPTVAPQLLAWSMGTWAVTAP